MPHLAGAASVTGKIRKRIRDPTEIKNRKYGTGLAFAGSIEIAAFGQQ